MNDAMTVVAVAALTAFSVTALIAALGFFDYELAPQFAEAASKDNRVRHLADRTWSCSWRPRLFVNIFTRMAYVAAVAFAVGAGVWAGSWASLPRPHNGTSRGQRLGVVARHGIVSADDILARLGLPAKERR